MKGRHVEGGLRLGTQVAPHRAGAPHRAAAPVAGAAGRSIEEGVAGGHVIAAPAERADRAGVEAGPGTAVAGPLGRGRL